MKKACVILLSALYLLMSVGFTTQSHYCRGILVESMLAADFKANTPCPICKAANQPTPEKKKDCCKHEKELVRVTDKSLNTPGGHFHVKNWTETYLHRFLGSVFEPEVIPSQPRSARYASPLLVHPDNHLYILHCTYRV